MTELHKWEIEGRDVFIDRYSVHGIETMTREEAETRLNEYETLKAATEELSAKDAIGLSNLCMSMQGKAIHGKGSSLSRETAKEFWRGLVIKLRAYADTLEGKP